MPAYAAMPEDAYYA